ncbi:MAG: S41 family peptidase, partial [Terriglobales bacterium]
AWIDDLDYFFRPENAYPKEMRYSKPVVVLINEGTRSGKEALAFSLQHSGRAKLVGQHTAGAFLPGRLFPIDDRTALYLPTRDFEFMGRRLEGNGVCPDIEVAGNESDQRNSDDQYEKAVAVLLDILNN